MYCGPTIELVYPQSGSGGGSDTQAIDTTPGSIPSNTYFPIADNRDGALMTQMTAQVFFVSAAAKNAVLVPVGALRPAGAPAPFGQNLERERVGNL